MNNLLVIGAKGFARELVEIILQIDPETAITFFDDISHDLPNRLFNRYPIIRTTDEASSYFATVTPDYALGTGGPIVRREFFETFNALGGKPATIISPHAKIGIHENMIERGACILTDAIIESGNTIGEGTLVHIGTVITHNVKVGKFCEISPRAVLLGAVTLRNECRIGAGSVILPNVCIGNRVTVGAGAVVTKDVRDNTTVVGVPARPLVV